MFPKNFFEMVLSVFLQSTDDIGIIYLGRMRISLKKTRSKLTRTKENMKRPMRVEEVKVVTAYHGDRQM